jgi:hypothetical protein
MQPHKLLVKQAGSNPASISFGKNKFFKLGTNTTQITFYRGVSLFIHNQELSTFLLQTKSLQI